MTTRRGMFLGGAAAIAVLAAPVPSLVAPARADLFGGDVVVLVQQLAVMLQQLAQAQQSLALLQELAQKFNVTGVVEFVRQVQEVRDFFADVQGIGYDFQRIVRQVRDLYPANADFSNMGLTDILAFSNRWIQNAQNTYETAIRIQARIQDSEIYSQLQTETVLLQSQGGSLNVNAAAQKELLAIMIEGQNDLKALIATGARADQTRQMQDATIEASREQVTEEGDRDSFISRDAPGVRIGGQL